MWKLERSFFFNKLNTYRPRIKSEDYDKLQSMNNTSAQK